MSQSEREKSIKEIAESFADALKAYITEIEDLQRELDQAEHEMYDALDKANTYFHDAQMYHDNWKAAEWQIEQMERAFKMLSKEFN